MYQLTSRNEPKLEMGRARSNKYFFNFMIYSNK